MMNDKVAFSPDEAAHRVGVGRTLIFSEIKHGRLEARKAGARTVITAEALNAWLKSLPRRGSIEAALANRLAGRAAGTRHRAGRRTHQ
jgi:excisionase family DNA binding protein